MWRRRPIISVSLLHSTPSLYHQQPTRFLSSSSSSSNTNTNTNTNTTTNLYSFLKPSIFSLPKPPPPPVSTTTTTTTPQPPPNEEEHYITTLKNSLLSQNTEEAWKSFKSLTSLQNPSFPPKPLTNSLITHLSFAKTHPSNLGLKRAFASLVYFIEKSPHLLEFQTVISVFESLCRHHHGNPVASPAFALVNCMFKNRYFVPFRYWGGFVVEISRKARAFAPFLRVFNETCRVCVDEKVESLKPDLDACNAALEASCKELQSVFEAEKVVENMALLGVRPDEMSFGFLGYLYALKGRKEKVIELKELMGKFGFSSRKLFYRNLISGYVKSGNLESVSDTIVCALKEEVAGEDQDFDEGTYNELVNGFLKDGSNIKGLANLITEAQKLEAPTKVVDKSIGFRIINACVTMGLSDKAHSILEEMDAQAGSVGLGVYVPILKAYCKERRTVEATQLVMDISNSGLKLDAESYDLLIEASITSQDFHSAFTLFRDMREARTLDLKASYLTIMTGLMENQRPELMAAFLDEVVSDPGIEVKTHDWNSIIHAFCKSGRLEDAKRTLRRMIFLRFEPNDQTYLSLINGYVTAEQYFSVLILWNEVKRKISMDKENGIKFDPSVVDAFLYAFVKGGYFDAVMQVVEKSQEMKIFVDKWRYKQAFMENHKKLKISKLRRRSFRKMEALIAFKNWAGLSA